MLAPGLAENRIYALKWLYTKWPLRSFQTPGFRNGSFNRDGQVLCLFWGVRCWLFSYKSQGCLPLLSDDTKWKKWDDALFQDTRALPLGESIPSASVGVVRRDPGCGTQLSPSSLYVMLQRRHLTPLGVAASADITMATRQCHAHNK